MTAPGILTTNTIVKDAIPKAGSDNDALMTRLCKAVSDAINTFCNRKFEKAEYVDEVYDILDDGNGSNVIHLKQAPIVEITSLKDGDTVIDASDYHIDKEARRVILKNFSFSGLRYNIKVSYKAGYIIHPATGSDPTDLNEPKDLEEAATEWVVKIFQHQTTHTQEMESMSIAGQNIVIRQKTMPDFTGDILERYKFVVF